MPSPSKLSVQSGSVADNRVVGDVPVAAALLQVNRVVIVEERQRLMTTPVGALFDINAYRLISSTVKPSSHT